MWVLSQWMGRGLAFQIEQHNHLVRIALRKRLLAMKPGEFEELVSQLLVEMGLRDGRGDQAQRRWRHRCTGHPRGGRRGPHQDGRPGQKVEAQEQHPDSGGTAGARELGSAQSKL